LKALGELTQMLAENPEFTLVHAEAIEKVLKQAITDIGNLAQAWRSLQDEDRLQEVVCKTPWKRSAYGNSEYVAAELVPTLVQAVKAKQGRLYAGGYVYVLSKNGKWVQRYPRGGEK